MATTSFTDGETIIVASWLNEVDALVHDVFNGLSTTTKGDVLASNGTNIIPLAVGSNNQVLTADSSEATGVKWAAAGGDVVDDTTPQLGGPLDPNGKFIGMDKGEDVASGTPTIGEDGDYFDVTGTTTISAFTVAANRHFFCQFDGALQLTHNSTDLDLPGEANITTAAGDVAEFFSTGANDVQCVNYTKADGKAVGGGDVVDDTSPQLGGSLDCQGEDITAAGTLKMTEQAAAESDTAGAGQIWVKNDVPCSLYYTGDTGVDNRISGITLSAEQSTSGVTDFTGIPTGVKHITVIFEGLSLDGTDSILVQLGDAGGIETSGYVSAGANQAGSVVTSTAGFMIRAGAAGEAISGHMTLTLLNSSNFSWISSSMATKGDGCIYSGGKKDLSAELTQVRITVTGSDSFDAGAAAIHFS
jgi:hypothetical protein